MHGIQSFLFLILFVSMVFFFGSQKYEILFIQYNKPQLTVSAFSFYCFRTLYRHYYYNVWIVFEISVWLHDICFNKRYSVLLLLGLAKS